MDVYKTEKAVYTTTDFVVFNENNLLEITPKFQRRGVWRAGARSYFIDSLLRGMTIPPIYLRWVQSKKHNKAIRQIVDGQQRIRAVLDFVADDYRLSSTLTGDWAGKRYSQLTQEQQTQIKDFSFSAEIFKGISDSQVLEVFCRLNMNGVPLNRQELRNGRYFGLFKQTSYALAHEYLEFWRHHKIFTELGIARMLEVELTSELLITGMDGMQDKKKSINTFYEQLESSYPNRERDATRFRVTLETISEAFSTELSQSEFRRPPLFYTLYCVVYHHIFRLPEIQRSAPKKRLNSDDREELKDAVVKLSEYISESKEASGTVPKKYLKFIAACQRQTDNIAPRKIRFASLYDEAF